MFALQGLFCLSATIKAKSQSGAISSFVVVQNQSFVAGYRLINYFARVRLSLLNPIFFIILKGTWLKSSQLA